MKEISGGRHFRRALKKLKRKYKRAGTLADSSDVPRSVISRALSGESRPGLKTLNKLVDLLPVEDGGELVAAYLTDQIPPKLNQDLRVFLRQKPGDSWQYWEPFVQKMLSLPLEKRAALEVILDMLNPHSPPVLQADVADSKPLPLPGSRDDTQAQGSSLTTALRKKTLAFSRMRILYQLVFAGLNLTIFSMSSDCEHFFHSPPTSCPEDEKAILYAEIHEEHKSL
jgi:Helix-turn-helix